MYYLKGAVSYSDLHRMTEKEVMEIYTMLVLQKKIEEKEHDKAKRKVK